MSTTALRRQRAAAARSRAILPLHQATKATVESLERRLLFTTITVTDLGDNTTLDGKVTLREAIQAAETNTSVDGSASGFGADTIVFDPALTTGGDATITLSLFDTGLGNGGVGNTAFVVNTNIKIIGPGGNNGITIHRDFGEGFRFFQVKSGAALT